MTSIVLGINCGHDATACLLVNGKISAAVAEERLNRNKMHLGFPWLSIKEVLRISGVNPKSLDAVVVPHNAYLNAHPFFINRIMRKDIQGIDIGNEFGLVSLAREVFYQIREGGRFSTSFSRTINGNYAKKKFQLSLEELGIRCPLLSIEHHLAHAASAYYNSGFEECLVITLDGSGDGLSHTTNIGRKGSIFRLASTSELFSPGIFYSAITKFLGYERHRHEGKITGLSAFGDPCQLYPFLQEVLCLSEDKNSFSSQKNFNFSFFQKVGWSFRLFSDNYFRGLTTNYLLNLFEKNLSSEKPEDIAAAAQKVLEDSTVELVKKALKETGMQKIALAGGVCGNVRLNQKISEIEGVEEIFICPNMGDGGCALGGALHYFYHELKINGEPFQPQKLENVYWGPEYTDDEIKSELLNIGLDFKLSDDVEEETAKYIAQGHVVGRFSGRMEYGPRALGNRSILVEPLKEDISKILNTRLKRNDFMPFAPSILEEDATKYFDRVGYFSHTAEFMTISCNFKSIHHGVYPAVTHIDYSARPHIVCKKSNPSFHKVLSKYKEKTGVPLLLNTSFNAHENPIVCSPKDALNSLLQGCVDVLSIGNFIVFNPNIQVNNY
jgi:carbamoyltransferase